MGKKKGYSSRNKPKSKTSSKGPNQKIRPSMSQIRDFMEGNIPQVPMHSLFPATFQLPPISTMSEEQIANKVDEISDILLSHNINLDFCEKTPASLIYNYLISEIIPNDEINAITIEGCFTTFNGCTGYCPGCFQKDYCENSWE